MLTSAPSVPRSAVLHWIHPLNSFSMYRGGAGAAGGGRGYKENMKQIYDHQACAFFKLSGEGGLIEVKLWGMN